MGNHKAAGQFFTHLKKNEVRRPAWAELAEDGHVGAPARVC